MHAFCTVELQQLQTALLQLQLRSMARSVRTRVTVQSVPKQTTIRVIRVIKLIGVLRSPPSLDVSVTIIKAYLLFQLQKKEKEAAAATTAAAIATCTAEQ